MIHQDSSIKGIIKSLGLVFGDIGTSPIYTLTVIFLLTKPTPDNVLGVLSLIIWTLLLLVTVEYAWLAMSLGKKGEGGTIVLKELLVPLLKSGRKVSFVTLLAFIGVSLLIGDGVITPAISILSAVEGTLLIPGLKDMGQENVILISALIAVLLFLVQKKGTDRISIFFGPLMLVWFAALAVSGIYSLMHSPSIVKAVNPYYGLRFIYDNGITGFFVLSEVILCATGGEALYADMGHLGRKPILRAWYLVFCALVLSYLGQAAFVLHHPEAKNVLFEMIFTHANYIYVPFLILSVIATVIASQAMISGMFSIVYQGITTHIMPLFRVDYTSVEMRAQIYIAAVNWFLLVSVLFIMYEFRESSKLAAAYGLAVTGTMTLTGIMMTWIFHLRKKMMLASISLFVTVIDVIFLVSNAYKIPHGGYWSLIIAAVPFLMILVYTFGQRKLYRSLRPMKLETFVERYDLLYKNKSRIEGTALFFVRDTRRIPPFISNTMLLNNIIYEDNIMVSVIKRDDPFGVTGYFLEDIAPGLRHFEIQCGYMEIFSMESIFKEAGIDEKTIFYGIEDIIARNIIWKIFALIKKLTPSFVQFYKMPPHKLHGVVTRIEM
ncbi:MAG: KUP/HAK/KT family potassium transporter [Nitrospiraceae bacterium]|nr:KUP/HAK/KT family potassium transporter [Nitrospiraceae bacterium]